MKTFSIIVLLAISMQLYSQQTTEVNPIQNFYTTCRADKLTAFNYKNLGIQYFYRGKYSKSIEQFNKSLEKDNTLCDSWYLIGYSYQQLGDYGKSIESCDKSIELNPWSVSAYVIKGYSNFYLNDTVEAIRNFEKAKEIGPEKIDSYYGLALIKYLQKDYDSAMNEITQYKTNNGTRTSRRDIKTLGKLEAELQNYNMIIAKGDHISELR